jgi:hypothetical protein
MRTAVFVLCVSLAASAVEAQTDPIRCWWRTTTGAVAIGERFDAALTCAVREQETTRTVPDETRLAAAVVQLAPFEVLGGSHPADLRSPTHRFFQYEYSLRIINRDVVGRDATFPDLQIPYRVHTLSNGEWIAGRDRVYVIPAHAVRVLSLVPVDATDIRDTGSAGFATIDALRFRARVFDIAGYALLLLGVIVATPALVSLARRRRVAGETDRREVPRRALLRAVEAELSTITRESGGGWSADLVARALSALRLAAAIAVGRAVAWRPLHPDGAAAGLVVSRGLWRKHAVEVSSAITATDLLSWRAARAAALSAEKVSALDELIAGIQALSTAAYREQFHTDGLDEVFATARRAAARLTQR